MLDLGITISNNLKWNKHINTICNKAEKHLWLVIRTLSFRAPLKAKLTTYIAMIRSIIEYGSPVWSPSKKNLRKEVEAIQRKATNFIMSNPRYDSPNYVDYKTRLITLNLLPTSYRREMIDITLFLKSIHNKTNLDLSEYLHFPDRQLGPRTRQTARKPDSTKHT